LFALCAASAVVTSIAQSHAGAVRTFEEASLTLRLSNALVAYAKYLLRAFWVFQRKTRPYLIVGWLWFVGTLVPVIGFVQVGGQTMADRYFYIPSIGLFIALVFTSTHLAKSWRVAPSLTIGIAIGVLLIFATLTNAQ